VKLPFNFLYEFFYYFFPNNSTQRKDPMLNLVLPFVANMLKDIVADKAQSLAVEHLEPHLEKLPKEVRQALDDAVDGDNAHPHKSVMDLIKG
tara:strand:+ start:1065 stop:1340 length:276 start_codon:yes stop_codon:yes gene_type:complete